MIKQFSLESKADALTYYNFLGQRSDITNNDKLEDLLSRVICVGTTYMCFEEYQSLVSEFITTVKNILGTSWDHDEAVALQLTQLILLKRGYLLFSEELQDPQNIEFKNLFNSTF